jgi:site-specific recombinase XerD
VRLRNWLTPKQGRRLLECAAPSSARELRDHAMVAMLIGCGLRRAELLALRVESFLTERVTNSAKSGWLTLNSN